MPSASFFNLGQKMKKRSYKKHKFPYKLEYNVVITKKYFLPRDTDYVFRHYKFSNETFKIICKPYQGVIKFCFKSPETAMKFKISQTNSDICNYADMLSYRLT